MGASKTYQYETKTKNIAKIASALGHPARVLIVEKLRSRNFIRNVDLMDVLLLSRSSIHNHVQKLLDADLIQVDFHPNEYHLCLKTENLVYLSYFLDHGYTQEIRSGR